jgi:hypothetical protein
MRKIKRKGLTVFPLPSFPLNFLRFLFLCPPFTPFLSSLLSLLLTLIFLLPHRSPSYIPLSLFLLPPHSSTPAQCLFIFFLLFFYFLLLLLHRLFTRYFFSTLLPSLLARFLHIFFFLRSPLPFSLLSFSSPSSVTLPFPFISLLLFLYLFSCFSSS